MADLATNKRARFDYEILETYEAGIALSGHEVKAVRTGKARLEGSFVVVRGGEAFLVGASISPYQPANTAKNYDPERARTLLLSKKDLAILLAQSEKKGLTIVPLSMYNKKRLIKIAVAVVRGKKEYDKRQKIREREDARAALRTLKHQKH